MNIKIEIKKNKNLSKAEKNLINNQRVKEFGKEEFKNFKKDYESETLWFFVKDEDKVVSLGGLRPIKLNYLGKKFKIKGICSIISIVKKRDYGRILIAGMLSYLKNTQSSALGFTEKTKFFEKAGLGITKDFIKRFVYINPKTKKKVFDNSGDGIYYNGKDKFITKVLKTKSLVKIPCMHW